MTDDELAVIEARLAAATPGKWVINTDPAFAAKFGFDPCPQILTSNWHRIAQCFYASHKNAPFIAHAPDDVRRLLAEVRRLRALVQ
jgi:hypothetical protein